jgi:hypothetical protein
MLRKLVQPRAVAVAYMFSTRRLLVRALQQHQRWGTNNNYTILYFNGHYWLTSPNHWEQYYFREYCDFGYNIVSGRLLKTRFKEQDHSTIHKYLPVLQLSWFESLTMLRHVILMPRWLLRFKYRRFYDRHKVS